MREPKKDIIDIEHWERKEHFAFFSGFAEPFFGLSVNVECTGLYRDAKQRQQSFYLRYLHAIMEVVNSIDALRLRIEEKQVVRYDRIDVSATVLRSDHTFGFSYIPFSASFSTFVNHAQQEIQRVQESRSLLPSNGQDNVVHFSAIPWVKFTSLSHARPLEGQDSCPKISVGKLYKQGEKWFLPISFHAHHALADGYHAGLFYQRVEAALNRSVYGNSK